MDERAASRRRVGSAVLLVSALVVAVGRRADLDHDASQRAGPDRGLRRLLARLAPGAPRPSPRRPRPHAWRRPPPRRRPPRAALTAASLASQRAIAARRGGHHLDRGPSPGGDHPHHRPPRGWPTTVPRPTAPPTTVAVPPSAAAVLACIRQRESGGNYAAVSAERHLPRRLPVQPVQLGFGRPPRRSGRPGRPPAEPGGSRRSGRRGPQPLRVAGPRPLGRRLRLNRPHVGTGRVDGRPVGQADRVRLTRTQVVELLEANGLAPSRALGQNFVVDPNTVDRVVRLAEVGPDDHVVEIGGGLGALTLALAGTGADRGDGGDRSPRAAGAAPDRRARRGGGGRGRRPGDWTGSQLLASAPTVVAGGQPALQRGHAAGLRPARRRARHRPDAGHGAARGGGAAGRRRRRPGLRHPLGQGGLLGHGPVGRAGAAHGVPAPAPRGVGAGAHPASGPAGGRQPTRTSSSTWCGPASASAARCCAARWPAWSTPRASSRPGSAPRPAPRSSTSRPGVVWPTSSPDVGADRRAPGPSRAGSAWTTTRPSPGKAPSTNQVEPLPASLGVEAGGRQPAGRATRPAGARRPGRPASRSLPGRRSAVRVRPARPSARYTAGVEHPKGGVSNVKVRVLEGERLDAARRCRAPGPGRRPGRRARRRPARCGARRVVDAGPGAARRRRPTSRHPGRLRRGCA